MREGGEVEREGGRQGETARSTQRPAEVRAQFTARFTSLLTLRKLAFLIRETGQHSWAVPASQRGGPAGGAISVRIVVKPLKNLLFTENCAKPKY